MVIRGQFVTGTKGTKPAGFLLQGTPRPVPPSGEANKRMKRVGRHVTEVNYNLAVPGEAVQREPAAAPKALWPLLE